MKAHTEGGHLVIRIPLKREPHPSSTGKTLIVATTDGPADTGVEIDGKPVGVRLIAWIPRWSKGEGC